MTQDVRVELADRFTAGALFERICQLYREAFSQPPFNRTAFYRALGWRYVGRQKGTPAQPSALFDTYVLPLGSCPSRDG